MGRAKERQPIAVTELHKAGGELELSISLCFFVVGMTREVESRKHKGGDRQESMAKHLIWHQGQVSESFKHKEL